MRNPATLVRTLLSNREPSHPIPPMDGTLSPNSRLDELDALDVDLRSPDDVASDGCGGLIVSNDVSLTIIGADGKTHVLSTFESNISAFVRLEDGSLVVAIDNAGLRHLDANGTILASTEAGKNRAPTGITALAPDAAGGVYFTVGSTQHLAADWAFDLMECNRSGRLGHWRPGAEPTWLADDLAFPNGILLEADHTHILITEAWAHRITRYTLAGGKVQLDRVVVGNLPGYPARISHAAGGGYWLTVFAARTQLVELILGDRGFRRDMMRSVEPELWIRPTLADTGSHLEPLQMGGVRKLGIRKPWAPPRSYGLVMRLDHDGEVIDSLHSRVGGLYHGIVAAREIGHRLIIVSKGNHRLLAAPLSAFGKHTHKGAT